MNLNELHNSTVVEAQLVWARKGNQLTRKYRCSVGQRAGRLVSKPGQCGAPIDLKKRMTLRRTKAKFGQKMARKAAKTKKFNPASKALRRLNKPARRK
jgi:hypothetical protein|tara:strand:- start:2594 stop:2887 length:294 start_codon:yes stop_codon:yes gene_type:complete